MSTNINGNVDAEVAVVREELRDVRVEHETFARVDRRLDAVVDAPRRRLPRQSSLRSIQLQSTVGR